jgi:hypothetical protein
MWPGVLFAFCRDDCGHRFHQHRKQFGASMTDDLSVWGPCENQHEAPDPEATSPAWLPVAFLVAVVAAAMVGLWWWG